MITREGLKKIKENELRKDVLIPLFEAMGFRDVTDFHGTQELGKDIVMWKEDETGSRENYAIVAKASRVTGNASKVISEIRTQVDQCFGSSYKETKNHSEQFVNKCWIISSSQIKPEAREKLISVFKSSNLDKNIRIIDGNELWKLIEKYLIKETFWDKANDIDNILDSLSPHYSLELNTKKGKKVLSVSPKYPEALKDHPITFTGSFITPTTPEGEKIRKDLDDFLKKGTPVEIEKPFFEGFELPDFISQIFGKSETSKIKLESNPPKEPIPVRIEFNSADGTSHKLEYISLVIQKEGIEETALVNQNQNIPVQTILVFNAVSKKATITLKSKSGVNARQWLDGILLKDALAKKGEFVITFLDHNTDPLILEIEEQPSKRISNNNIEFLEKLVLIQEKTQCTIYFPPEKIAKEDIDSVDELIQIITTGKLGGTWNSLDAEFYRDGVNRLVNSLENKSELGISLILASDMSKKLFDTEIPLGRVRMIFENAIPQNGIEELREFLKTASKEDYISIRLVPSIPNSKSTMLYLDWQPNSES